MIIKEWNHGVKVVVYGADWAEDAAKKCAATVRERLNGDTSRLSEGQWKLLEQMMERVYIADGEVPERRYRVADYL